MAKKKKPTPKRFSKQWFVENVLSLGLALILVLMIRSSLIEAYKIPSGSMIPTLLIGDHIFVNKLSYGLKVPFTEWFGDPVYIYKAGPPERGDIIVFKFPLDESVYYIKRVVGTPGDTVELRDSTLLINEKPIPTKSIPDDKVRELFKSMDSDRYSPTRMRMRYEKLAEHQSISMIDESSYYDHNFGPVKVPEDQFFVMGDNRDYSNDSRKWGFVPMANVKGKAVIIWLSIWLDDMTFRPSRIGTLLK